MYIGHYKVFATHARFEIFVNLNEPRKGIDYNSSFDNKGVGSMKLLPVKERIRLLLSVEV